MVAGIADGTGGEATGANVTASFFAAGACVSVGAGFAGSEGCWASTAGFVVGVWEAGAEFS